MGKNTLATTEKVTMPTIRPLTVSDHSEVMKIVETLPEWFDSTARQKSIPMDLKHQKGFVALIEDITVGFITLYVADGKLHIGWLGVRKDFHRQGVGTQLLLKAEEQATALGFEELVTYTLGDSVDYKPYELTRNFYFRSGFQVYLRKQTDNPGCTEELWISKRVNS